MNPDEEASFGEERYRAKAVLLDGVMGLYGVAGESRSRTRRSREATVSGAGSMRRVLGEARAAGAPIVPF